MAREARTGLGFADRLVLLMAWIGTCGLVYVLGFYVGKGTQEHRLGVEEQVVRLPVTSRPPPEGQRAKTETEFGFYEKLMGDHPGDAAPRPGAEARAPAVPAPALAVKPVATATPPKAPVAAVVPAKVPPAPAVTAAVPAAARTPLAVPPPPPAKPLAPPSRPPADAAPSPALAPHPAPPTAIAAHPAATAAPTPPRSATATAGGGWTVLANPTQNRDEADGLVRQLRGRGYDATLVRVVRDGGTWYRVQVGRFATSDQASETMHRLREHEGVTHAFVASE